MLSAPEIAQDPHAVERADLRVQIIALHADLRIILSQILRHALGQRRHQHPLIVRRAFPDLIQQIVHLALDRPDLNLRDPPAPSAG